MPSTYTSGKTQLIDPANGSFVDSWDQPVNCNFSTIDASLSGTTIINIPSTTTPGTPYVTLVFPTFPTYSQPWTQPLAGQNLRLQLTGALGYNVSLYIPANIPGLWIVDNQTSNSYTITIKTNAPGSVGVAVPQGYMSSVFCDGTNVYWSDQGNVIANVPNAIPAGCIFTFGMTQVPNGFLVCNGAAVSRTTYSRLFAAIGTYWGPGDSSTTFNVPNLQGYFLRGWSDTGTIDPGRTFASTQADGVGPLTINDPGHVHDMLFQANTVSSGGGNNGIGGGNRNTASSTTGITITNTISETRPVNIAVQYGIST